MHKKDSVCQETPLRPYEKCETYGSESLSDAELMAVIIKSGCSGISAVQLSESILNALGGLNGLMDSDSRELMSFKGVGRVKLIQLACISELAKRISRARARDYLDIRNPQTVADYYMEYLRHKSEEEVHIMLLSSKDALIKSIMISKGTICNSAISPREVFKTALKYNAAGIILVHNHPSGDPTPSADDIHLMQNIRQLGIIMNVPLKDSVIIGDNRYISFLEEDLF